MGVNDKKISQLTPVTTLTGNELIPVAVNGGNGSITVDDIVSRVSKSTIGLGNVDDTSDADKPVSTATQSALDGKSDTGHSHQISDVQGLSSQLNGINNAFTALNLAVGNKADINHTHTVAQITGLDVAIQAAVQTAITATEDVAVGNLDW